MSRLRWILAGVLAAVAAIASVQSLLTYLEHHITVGVLAVLALAVTLAIGLVSLAKARLRIERELQGLRARPPQGELYRQRVRRLDAIRAAGARPDPETLAESSAAEEAGRAYIGRYLVATTVLIGLVGTFAGLMETLGKVSPLLSESGNGGLALLAAPLAGLHVTFGASLVAILATLSLALAQGDLALHEELALAALRDLTTHELVPQLFPVDEDGADRTVRAIVELKQTFGDALVRSLEKSAGRLAAETRAESERAAKALEAAAGAVEKQITRLCDSIATSLAEGSRKQTAAIIEGAAKQTDALSKNAAATAESLARSTATGAQALADLRAQLQQALERATAQHAQSLTAATDAVAARLGDAATTTLAALRSESENALGRTSALAEQTLRQSLAAHEATVLQVLSAAETASVKASEAAESAGVKAAEAAEMAGVKAAQAAETAGVKAAQAAETACIKAAEAAETASRKATEAAEAATERGVAAADAVITRGIATAEAASARAVAAAEDAAGRGAAAAEAATQRAVAVAEAVSQRAVAAALEASQRMVAGAEEISLRALAAAEEASQRGTAAGEQAAARGAAAAEEAVQRSLTICEEALRGLSDRLGNSVEPLFATEAGRLEAVRETLTEISARLEVAGGRLTEVTGVVAELGRGHTSALEETGKAVLAAFDRAVLGGGAALDSAASVLAQAAKDLRAGTEGFAPTITQLTVDLQGLGREVALMAARTPESDGQVVVMAELERLGTGVDRLTSLFELSQGGAVDAGAESSPDNGDLSAPAAEVAAAVQAADAADMADMADIAASEVTAEIEADVTAEIEAAGDGPAVLDGQTPPTAAGQDGDNLGNQDGADDSLRVSGEVPEQDSVAGDDDLAGGDGVHATAQLRGDDGVPADDTTRIEVGNAGERTAEQGPIAAAEGSTALARGSKKGKRKSRARGRAAATSPEETPAPELVAADDAPGSAEDNANGTDDANTPDQSASAADDAASNEAATVSATDDAASSEAADASGNASASDEPESILHEAAVAAADDADDGDDLNDLTPGASPTVELPDDETPPPFSAAPEGGDSDDVLSAPAAGELEAGSAEPAALDPGAALADEEERRS